MLCSQYKIPFSGAHRAINDVKATINLFEKEIETIKNFEEEKKLLIKQILSISNDKNVKFLEDLIFPFFSSVNIDFDVFRNILFKQI
jgi:DNA polymerase III alpha subunit (gram-positive type)